MCSPHALHFNIIKSPFKQIPFLFYM
ncbi:MAG: hypothetical protein EOM05_04995 [Clostridia bacterium]|nr:hypothetical protein [Clostridia bacterium]